MSKQEVNKTLIKKVKDKELIKDFYLDRSIEELADKFYNFKFSFHEHDQLVPFNAQIRGYRGVVDNEDSCWIVKKISDEEIFFSVLGELAYFIDLSLQTLSAPNLLIKIENSYFRASKVIKKATQISGYNYLEEPLRKELANDLINRWLMFDEDRNPNNYLIIHNSKQEALIVAIDYNHADLEAEEMKITGKEDEFGWNRAEKTRFLTLLKPSNFECYTINDFKERLDLMKELTEKYLYHIALLLFNKFVEGAEEKALKITSCLTKRSQYISDYFYTWFKNKDQSKSQKSQDNYSSLGKTFVDFYKRKV